MPSHFSSIGIPINSNEEMLQILKKVSESSKTVKCKKGKYQIWESASGAELWIQITNNNDLIGVTPYFSGDSIIKCGLISLIKKENDTQLENTVYAWANPNDNNPETGAYPFVFDFLNIGMLERIKLPQIVYVKISAFAHELTIYKSEADFEQKKETKPGFASKSFIPSGTFLPNGEKKDPPTSEAIFTGIILDYKKLSNEITNKNFYWIKAETYGGLFDIVVDEVLVNEEIIINGIVSGIFYLCGKVIENNVKIKNLFGK